MDLTTSYMGLELKNPLIVGSSGITRSVEGVTRSEEAGAGAVVLKSVFEEEIEAEVREVAEKSHFPTLYPEARDYLERYGRDGAFEDYLGLIRESKKAASIPVIASIHCVSAGAWTDYAARVQEAGADGLELNLFVLPSDPRHDGRQNEQSCLEIAKTIRRKVEIPVAMKIGSYFSGLALTATQLSHHVDALVLFNRFSRVDFDIENLSLVPAEMFSSPEEIVVPLRWISILSERVDCDLAATTGVHDGAGVIKQLLAGAAAVQVCSALYRAGNFACLKTMLEEVTDWMSRHGFSSVSEFRGRMSQKRSTNPAAYERVQFMTSTSDTGLP